MPDGSYIKEKSDFATRSFKPPFLSKDTLKSWNQNGSPSRRAFWDNVPLLSSAWKSVYTISDFTVVASKTQIFNGNFIPKTQYYMQQVLFNLSDGWTEISGTACRFVMYIKLVGMK